MLLIVSWVYWELLEYKLLWIRTILPMPYPYHDERIPEEDFGERVQLADDVIIRFDVSVNVLGKCWEDAILRQSRNWIFFLLPKHILILFAILFAWKDSQWFFGSENWKSSLEPVKEN